MEIDASNLAIEGILFQHGEDGHLHSCAYQSPKMTNVEKNYNIYEKELLSIVLAFQDWQVYLEGPPHQTWIILDHKNLKKFLTTKQLNQSQV